MSKPANPGALQSNLAALCAASVLNLPEQQASEEPVRVDAVLRWLEKHKGWLLILDNVDSPEAATAVDKLAAQLSGGDVLLTSRLSDWGGGVAPFEIDVLDRHSAVAFLLERTEGSRPLQASDEADAAELAEALGGLALALEQAGAFISTRRIALSDYVRRWRDGEARVRTWFDPRLMKYPHSVAVTWDTTVNQLSEPGLALLRLLAWFAPEPIPRTLLATAEASQQLGSAVARLQVASERSEHPPTEPMAADIESALAELSGYSLLKWEADRSMFLVHRLVQEVTRERITPSERDFWLRAALSTLDDAVPGDPPPNDVRSWSLWDVIRPHVAALSAWGEAQAIGIPTTRLMNLLALYLYARALFSDAEPLMRRALSIDEQSYGKDHPNVARDLNNLAQLLQATNRLAEAEPLMRRALSIDEQSYGNDHPSVAIHLNNLAQLLHATNRLAEAEPLMGRALSIDEQSYGKDHPSVAIRFNNLAQLLKATNRLAEAEPLMRCALSIDEQSYGKDHPNIAIRLNNLAQLLQATNRLAEAEPLMRRALSIDEQSYGNDHPRVAIHLNNLAQLLQATNRLADAEPLMRRALEIFENSLGKDHPNSGVVRRNLEHLRAAIRGG